MKSFAPIFISILFLFTACTEDRSGKSRGPIVLGDSSSIVTETDPKRLQDRLPDFQPPASDTEDTDRPANPSGTDHTDAAAPAQPAAQPAPNGNGLTVAFKEVTIFISGITTRTFGKPDLQRARGATYELSGGNLAGNQLRISGGTVQKIAQRYQTIIALKDGQDVLPLESLSATAPTQTLSGNNGAFTITGLDPARLVYANASPSAIRNAVQQAARRKRMSREDTRAWMETAKDVRAANQPPAVVVLRSVSWRIEGKDAGGRSFSKELRIDVPL